MYLGQIMDRDQVEGHVMSEGCQYQIRVLEEKDRAKLKKLLSDTFKMSDEFFAWKYDSNPDFDQSLVVVAVNCGEVVGCNNWMPRNLKISRSLSVRAALGADLAVHRNHRGRGLAKPLIASENTILEDKNIVMSYGFIDAKLVEHVHGPLIGLVEVPTSTTVYKKYLNLSHIREKVIEMNRIVKSDEEIKRKLAGLDVSVLFRLRGVPPFTMRIGPDEICLEENNLTNPNLKVECDMARLDLVRSKRKTLALIKTLLTRKIRIKGSMRDAIKLYRLSELLGILFA